MKKLLFSLILISAVSIGLFAVTNAFFSDTETSSSNLLAAGTIDLKIDNDSYYNGQPWPNTSWDPDDLSNGHLFLNFTDIKPDDEGEDTISIHVNDNESWACVDLTFTKDDDISCTEPELINDPTCDDPDADLLDGELGNNVNFVFWVDDGDNVLETTEASTQILTQGPATSALNSSWVLADATANNIGGQLGEGLNPNNTYFVGKAWCFGTLTLNPVADDAGVDPTVASGILCDGTNPDNHS